ncbi:MAG: DNA-3-methyladenine glycosylase I [Chloroflexi bacterium]|nr:DNA-3-methyladenine glycosylase I [Chloroflexota bacterium]
MIEASSDRPRCLWAGRDPLMVAYHDDEWGVPCRDDRELFARLALDGFQAGLSWAIILKKRDGFRRAFEGFDPDRVAGYGPDDVARLLADPGIIRNRQKIEATIGNARVWQAVQRETGSFAGFLWSFVGGQPLRHPTGYTAATLPATSPESDAMSKALRQHGFRFVGSTICYAFMQGSGLVDDHLTSCFRFVPRDGIR